MLKLFGEISVETFLEEYWQKKPLLVRGAFPSIANLISPEELAGLSLEEGTNSRLIIRQGEEWSIENGPFLESRFEELPTENYTLLVQEVDQYHSDVLRLKRHFRFLPDWRVDDVMVSFATPQGGVGPHVDHYDVFLIQGLGRRKWQISSRVKEDPEYLPNLGIKIMKDFQPTQEWVLEPGDMLYLPPMVPHNGEALDACMTYSVGFRAPSKDEILSAWLESYCLSLSDHDRYEDGNSLEVPRNPGQITAKALEHVTEWLTSIPKDSESVARWFGKLVTEPKRQNSTSEVSNYLAQGVKDEAIDEFRAILNAGSSLEWSENVRVAYFPTNESILFFVGGELLELHSSFLPIVEQLSNKTMIEKSSFDSWTEIEGSEELLAALHYLGILQIWEES